MTTYFGDIKDPGVIEDAVEGTLKTWLPTYQREVERQRLLDLDTLESVASWSRKSYFENITGDEFLPWVSIVSPGLADRPRKEGGQGRHRATWRVDVGVIVGEPYDPRKLAGYWAAAIRVCLLQKKALDLEAHVDWVGERYDDLSALMERSLGGARIQFEVQVYGVASVKSGPPEPDDDPGGPPKIQTHHETVHRKEDQG